MKLRPKSTALAIGSPPVVAIAAKERVLEPGQQIELNFISDGARNITTVVSKPGDFDTRTRSREVINRIVQEPMRLLTALTNLSLTQRRVIWLILHSVKNQQYLENSVGSANYIGMGFVFSVDDIVGGEAKPNSAFMHSLAQSLSQIQLNIPETKIDGTTVPGLVGNIFSLATYVTGKRQIALKLTPELMPCFLELGNNYAKYQLDFAMSLRSTYAQLLYGHTCRRIYRGNWRLSFEELRIALGCDQVNTYAAFSQFKRAILDPAVQQLAEHCNLAITYETTRAGKVVDTIVFTIKQSTPTEISQSEQQQILKQALDQLATTGVDKRRDWAAHCFKAFYHAITGEQRRLILTDEELLERFSRADCYVGAGLVEGDSATNYILRSVFNPVLAPARKSLDKIE